MADEMKGKVALVTGGASGIGRATAIAFAKKGASVAITDVADQMGQEVAQQIQSQQGKATYIHVDVSRAEEVEKAVQSTVAAFGRLDYGFNNAGIGGVSAASADYPLEEWARVISINLSGVFYSMKYELQQMLKQGSGAIVNMSSILCQVGFANSVAYVSAKHGVIGMTETAAIENAPKGIRVNAVCPGFIETPLLAGAGMSRGTDLYNAIARLHPIGRLGLAEEVAALVVWLCSDEASFVTGEAVRVDGGYVAQ
jgi:NAD(P)-dependent dehydrogenase (short-subunit alcohol dehydrogenase family)